MADKKKPLGVLFEGLKGFGHRSTSIACLKRIMILDVSSLLNEKSQLELATFLCEFLEQENMTVKTETMNLLE